MDALEAPAVETLRDADSAEPLARPTTTHLEFPPRLQGALATLHEALAYARDLDVHPWEFAVEISAMRRLRLSNSDLRWLVFRGLIDHASEVTQASDTQRAFRRLARPVFNKRSCFILLPAGEDAYRDVIGTYVETRPAGETRLPSAVQAAAALVPNWDRDRKELRVGSTVVKRFKIPASAEESLLAAFEELHWPATINDPWTGDDGCHVVHRLQQTIAALNRSQRNPLLRFTADAGGEWVRWELCSAASPSTA